MGQDKKQLTKLLAFVKGLYDDPDNKEFAAGIQAIVMADSKEIRDVRFEEIYEYCIQKNARAQAKAVYSKFPIKEISEKLSDDYLLMESFKRRGDFLNFSAQLFRQIEGIANFICRLDPYNQAFGGLKNTSALVLYNQDMPMSIFTRKTDSIAINKLIFGDYDKTKDGKDKVDIPICKQYILDKIKIALYLCGYATCLFSASEFNKFSYDISNIYLVRCEADHSGNERSPKQEAAFQTIIAEPDFYYSEFLKLLHFFIDKISEGYLRRQEVFDFASNLPEDELHGIVTNALPGALYIKCDGQESEPVPGTAYNRSTKFENGMELKIKKKGGTIIQVVPVQ